MPLKITKDTMIGELVMNYPTAVEVLFERGFHCIGCGLSAYETLEQGCLAHGFDETMVEELVRELNEKAKDALKIGDAAKIPKVNDAPGEGNAAKVGKNRASLAKMKTKKNK